MPVDISRFAFGQRIITTAIGHSLFPTLLRMA
jgi:hypothetical protein